MEETGEANMISNASGIMNILRILGEAFRHARLQVAEDRLYQQGRYGRRIAPKSGGEQLRLPGIADPYRWNFSDDA